MNKEAVCKNCGITAKLHQATSSEGYCYHGKNKFEAIIPSVVFPGDLRDHFAGEALAGLLEKHGLCGIGAGTGELSYVDAAEYSYAQADAMLKAREK